MPSKAKVRLPAPLICPALLAALALPAPAMAAETANSASAQAITLPTSTVDAESDLLATGSFASEDAPQVTKSALPLAETPRSVSVINRSVLDSQQALSLADALNNVPGVTAGQYGRRGWDDLIIRGQVASDSLFLDGLRTSTSSRVAEQPFGLERLEVLKGPASMEYGLVLPGGVVNMVSKRPTLTPFAQAGVTYGSHDLRQGTFDVGTPLAEQGKAAVRVNGLLSDSNDATDHIWFKNRYIAPSLSLDFGEDTDFTLLASHQDRQYIRQQGLPLNGSINANPNGSLSRDLFTGEPGQDPYHARENRLGYTLTHRFGDGWAFNQNLRWQEYTVDGQLIANGRVAANNRTLNRTAQQQHFDGGTISFDNNVQKYFETRTGAHDVTLGADYMRSRESAESYTCSVGTLDIYDPVYGSPVVCPGTPRSRQDTTVRMLGAYLRDTYQVNDRLLVTAGLRRDFTDTYSTNLLNGARSSNPANATTGAAAIMYELFPNVRPYLSFATSFFPNTGVDFAGSTFEPEKGRQWEAGIKFDLVPGKTLLSVAAFDLRRQNVLEDDPANDGYSVAIGEQRTRGAEIELQSDVNGRLSIMAGYAYTHAVITDDGDQQASTVGDRLNNVPRHTANVFARYRFNGSPLGWELNGGINAVSERYTNGYYLPGYATANVGVAYATPHWRAALNVKNLFDQHYYAGGLAQAVALGDDRTALMSVSYQY